MSPKPRCWGSKGSTVLLTRRLAGQAGSWASHGKPKANVEASDFLLSGHDGAGGGGGGLVEEQGRGCLVFTGFRAYLGSMGYKPILC